MSGETVLVLQRRMVEYRVPFFEALRERLGASGLALEVVPGEGRPSEEARRDGGVLPWARLAPASYLPGPEGPAVRLSLPADLLAGAALVVVPGDPGFLPLYALAARRRLRGRPLVALWGHGANFQRPREGRARRALRGWVNRSPDWWFAYTRLSVDRVAADGSPRGRITRLDNGVDTAALARWRDATPPEELEALRVRLGLPEGPRAAFVGGLHEHRRLPLLFAAADLLRARFPAFGLVTPRGAAARGVGRAGRRG